MQDRSSGETVRKEDQEEAIKKSIDKVVKEYVEQYVDKLFQAGCSVDVVKYCCSIAMPYLEDFCITEKLDEDDRDLYGEMSEDWGLESYLYKSIKIQTQEILLNLKEGDNREGVVVKGSKEIDYAGLREVLKYQVEEALKKSYPHPNDIPLIDDLDERTMRIFKYVYDEIDADTELNMLLKEKNIDDTVERLITLLSKHDGISIPPPYDDIDDWWGDFNGTINYLVWAYKEEMESERRWAQRHS